MTQIATRNYVFTYNNYPSDLAAFDDKLKSMCVYYIYGREIGLSGTPHLQGFFQLQKKERIRAVIGKLPGCHIEKANAGYDSNKKYCSKDGDFTEYGVPDTVGKRKGLADACEAVLKRVPMSEIANEQPEVFCRYYRGLEALSSALSTQRNFKTEVFWFYGSTGTGKSRRCADLELGAYWKPPTTKWWNGYDGQPAVVVDDYRRDFCTFAELLRLCDRYPYTVETKGGTRSFVSMRLYITTPKSPEETWEGRTPEDLGQLLRRIDHIEKFEKEDAVPEERDIRLPLDELVAKYGVN